MSRLAVSLASFAAAFVIANASTGVAGAAQYTVLIILGGALSAVSVLTARPRARYWVFTLIVILWADSLSERFFGHNAPFLFELLVGISIVAIAAGAVRVASVVKRPRHGTPHADR